MFGEAYARKLYRKRVRDLAKRRYAQKLEERKVGLPALSKERKTNADACAEAAGAIEALPITSLSVLAARVMTDFVYESGKNEPIADFDNGRLVMILTTRRPHIQGALARDVDELLADPDRPQSETWIGREGTLDGSSLRPAAGEDRA
jgi:hypothetical protein